MEQGERIKKWDMGAAVGTGFWGAALALQLAARNIPGFGQWYAVSVYPILTGTLGRMAGWLPFSVSEVLLYVLMAGYTVWAIYILLYAILGRKRKWYFKTYIKNTYLAAAFLFFLYTIGCGVNYYRKPFSAYLEYKTDVYTGKCLLDRDRDKDVQADAGSRRRRHGRAGRTVSRIKRALSKAKTAHCVPYFICPAVKRDILALYH